MSPMNVLANYQEYFTKTHTYFKYKCIDQIIYSDLFNILSVSQFFCDSVRLVLPMITDSI